MDTTRGEAGSVRAGWLLVIAVAVSACAGGESAAPEPVPDAPPAESWPPPPAPEVDDPSDDLLAEPTPDTDPPAAPDVPPLDDAPAPFPPVGDFGRPGPYPVVTEGATGPDHAFTLHYPDPPGEGGVMHPVITWGNGTGATPAIYAGLLRHLASHGFIVIASNSTMTGSGEEMIRGARWVVAQGADPTSLFYGVVDGDSVGATGHSQGGGGSLRAGNDPMIWLTAPIQPAPAVGSTRGLGGPMFLVAGERDRIVSAERLVRPLVYDLSPVETVYGVLAGADHFEPVFDGGRIRAPLTAWFRAHFMGDPDAARLFYDGCGLCQDPEWAVERKNLGR